MVEGEIWLRERGDDWEDEEVAEVGLESGNLKPLFFMSKELFEMVTCTYLSSFPSASGLGLLDLEGSCASRLGLFTLGISTAPKLSLLCSLKSPGAWLGKVGEAGTMLILAIVSGLGDLWTSSLSLIGDWGAEGIGSEARLSGEGRRKGGGAVSSEVLDGRGGRI